MDGRPHPADLEPGYFGHSIGHFEGDTLVIDTVGFNERFWFDQPGSPHTEQLHLIERLTRLDFNTIKYEITVDDPTTWTKPWTVMIPLRHSDDRIYEYACHEGNMGLAGILNGARADEKDAEQATKKQKSEN